MSVSDQRGSDSRAPSEGAAVCRIGRASLCVLAAVLAASASAHAEIGVLVNGRTLKLDAHRPEGPSVVLVLRGGGEVTVPTSEVLGFVPDEVIEEVAALPEGGDLTALVDAVARRRGLDPKLVRAVVAVESGFRPTAVSPKGATGLMQLMPATANELGVSDPLDPESNVDGGVRYLRQLLDLFGGDLQLALAAYNAGPGAVDRHKGVPPYRETREYVRKVMKRYKAKGEPAK